MTNESQSKSAQEAAIFQSAPARAWADTKGFLSAPSFWFMELAATALAATISFVLSLPPFIVVVSTSATPLLLLLLFGLFNLGRAPLRQRNEARKELIGSHQRLKPKLRVTAPRKSFDTKFNLANELTYIEYVRLVVANQSDSIASDCRVSLVGIRPKNRYTRTVIDGIPYKAADAFAGHAEIPFPISLSWSDKEAGSSATSRSIGPQGQAQVDVMDYIASADPYPAFSARISIQGFELPETAVVFGVRLDSDNCLPYFYVMCYLPNAVALGPIEPLQILREGSEIPDLEDFREDVPTVLPIQGD